MKTAILTKIYKRSLSEPDSVTLLPTTMFVMAEVEEAMDEYTQLLTEQMESVKEKNLELQEEIQMKTNYYEDKLEHQHIALSEHYKELEVLKEQLAISEEARNVLAIDLYKYSAKIDMLQEQLAAKEKELSEVRNELDVKNKVIDSIEWISQRNNLEIKSDESKQLDYRIELNE